MLEDAGARENGLGLKPKHTIYRVTLWDRLEFETAL
jgi:hypothetical protein